MTDSITAVRITGLTLQNFRNHKGKDTYDFGDITYVTGHNGTGKTTMAHGIAYALYGVSYWGDQKIDRLRNNSSDTVSVRLDFVDQNGNAHILTRSRNAQEKTTLTLDGYTVHQANIDRLFCDKDVFLSMFNPTYLAERLGEKAGRELILAHLPDIPVQDVLAQLGPFRTALEGIDLNGQPPEALATHFREEIRRAEEQIAFLNGHIEEMENAVNTAQKRLTDLTAEAATLREKIAESEQRQNSGIDRETLIRQEQSLRDSLTQADATELPRIRELRNAIAAVRERVYTSQYAAALADTQAEIKLLSQQHATLKARIEQLRPGTSCPVCMTPVTEDNFSEIRANMIGELKKIGDHGQALMERHRDIIENDRKARAVFEQFQQDDLTALTQELTALQDSKNARNIGTVREQLEEITATLRYGNLSEQEYSDLTSWKAELLAVEAQLRTISDMTDTERLKSAYAERDSISTAIVGYRNILTSLAEFAAKRSEMATQHLQMPHVTIRLYEIVRSTGEMKNVFRFEYDGREYSTLSLSEKTLAGMEVAAMLRGITGLDCPICVDNTESIASLNTAVLPSQTILLRFVKGQPLSVRNQSRAIQVLPEAENLRKAG